VDATLERIHSRLEHLLAGEGIALDGIYVCPHLPADSCGCRKPRPQLVHMAAAEHRFTPAECVVIGDQACDIGLGQALGATTVLVRTGYGERFAADPFINPHYIAHDLLDASRKAACNFT
jgi:D-glycero-D-manno-heptose 1,7-bisphosphate phosphatase